MSTNIKDLSPDSAPSMRTVWFDCEKSYHASACREFVNLAHTYKGIVDFTRPNPEKAPWHWKAVLTLDESHTHVPKDWLTGQTTILINVWPHQDKFQVGPNKAQYRMWVLKQMLDFLYFDKTLENTAKSFSPQPN